jgi:pilus assembly protein CpaB
VNARQRRGLFLVLLAAVLGLAAFVLVSNYVTQVRADVGGKVSAYRLTEDVDAFTEISPSMVRKVLVPKKWLGAGTLESNSFIGRRTAMKLPRNTYVAEEMLLGPSELADGEREIAINVDAETGVAGRLQPGDYVNINATLQEGDGANALRAAAVLVRRARIVSFGTQRDREDKNGDSNQVVPVTFALTERDSLRLLYAESFAESVRLSKVLPQDTTAPAGTSPYTSTDVEREFGGAQ